MPQRKRKVESKESAERADTPAASPRPSPRMTRNKAKSAGITLQKVQKQVSQEDKRQKIVRRERKKQRTEKPDDGNLPDDGATSLTATEARLRAKGETLKAKGEILKQKAAEIKKNASRVSMHEERSTSDSAKSGLQKDDVVVGNLKTKRSVHVQSTVVTIYKGETEPTTMASSHDQCSSTSPEVTAAGGETQAGGPTAPVVEGVADTPDLNSPTPAGVVECPIEDEQTNGEAAGESKTVEKGGDAGTMEPFVNPTPLATFCGDDNPLFNNLLKLAEIRGFETGEQSEPSDHGTNRRPRLVHDLSETDLMNLLEHSSSSICSEKTDDSSVFSEMDTSDSTTTSSVPVHIRNVTDTITGNSSLYPVDITSTGKLPEVDMMKSPFKKLSIGNISINFFSPDTSVSPAEMNGAQMLSTHSPSTDTDENPAICQYRLLPRNKFLRINGSQGAESMSTPPNSTPRGCVAPKKLTNKQNEVAVDQLHLNSTDSLINFGTDLLKSPEKKHIVDNDLSEQTLGDQTSTLSPRVVSSHGSWFDADTSTPPAMPSFLNNRVDDPSAHSTIQSINTGTQDSVPKDEPVAVETPVPLPEGVVLHYFRVPLYNSKTESIELFAHCPIIVEFQPLRHGQGLGEFVIRMTRASRGEQCLMELKLLEKICLEYLEQRHRMKNQ